MQYSWRADIRMKQRKYAVPEFGEHTDSPGKGRVDSNSGIHRRKNSTPVSIFFV